jgi:hypothetical protein
VGKKTATVPARAANVYDQACRFLLRLEKMLLLWFLGVTLEEVGFESWLPTQKWDWPGHLERMSDAVAWLVDHRDNDRPWALVAESELQADPEMFGRLLEYLGFVWRQARPSDNPGDRFFVGALVINLTGKGQTSQDMRLGRSGVRTELTVVERNLAELDAEQVLEQVRQGRAPRLLLALVPLMQKGGDPAILQPWLELARDETDKAKREALGLAVLFADKVGHGDLWKDALKGWHVMESKIVNEWTAKARAEAKAESLVQVVQGRFKEVPEDLRSAIQAVEDVARLSAWIDLAFQVRTLRQFRSRAGL